MKRAERNAKDCGQQMHDDDEFQPIIREEISRGFRRKRADAEERKKSQKTKADLARELASGDERAFMKIIRATGLKDGSPEFWKALGTFPGIFRQHVRAC